jgi:hypothetical protein
LDVVSKTEPADRWRDDSLGRKKTAKVRGSKRRGEVADTNVAHRAASLYPDTALTTSVATKAMPIVASEPRRAIQPK